MAAPDLLSLATQLAVRDTANAARRRARDEARNRDFERLEPIALELAAKSGANGFTVDNLRHAAVAAGVITGEEGRATGKQRALSWLGPFLTSLAVRGKIVALRYRDGNKVKRASKRDHAHGNNQIVYCLPEFFRVI